MSTAALIGDFCTLYIKSDNVWPIARQFNFVEEGNLANYYQGIQLLINCGLLLLIWSITRKANGPRCGHWLALTWIFLFLSADEVAQIHETTIAPLVAAARNNEEGKTGWMLVYLPLLAIFGLAYIPFLKHLPRKIAILFIVSGLIYIGGAVVFEKVANWFADSYGDDNAGYVLIDNFSEFLESAGQALFCYTLLSFLSGIATSVVIDIKDEIPDQPARS